MEVKLFKQYPSKLSYPGVFLTCNILSIALSDSRCIFDLGLSWNSSNSSHVAYPFGSFVSFSSFQYLAPKLSHFLVI